jgi:hypothetical protein
MTLFNDINSQLLLNAIKKRNLKKVENLVSIIDPNEKLIKFMLFYTLISELDKGEIKGNLHEIIKILVKDINLNLNTSTVYEKPILFYYLYYKEFELAKKLLQLGADVNAKVCTGNRNDEGLLLMEPLVCEFIQRMNSKRDFPEDFEKQIHWLNENGADESIIPDLL